MKLRVLALAITVATLAALLSACGGGSTTTVKEATAEQPKSSTAGKLAKIEKETEEAELEAAEAKKEAAQQAAKAKKAAARRAASEKAEEPQATQENEESTSEPPDVIGMRLPEAESTLSAAGFRTEAENTDTTFGIVIRSHYTVCTESEPHGNVVTVLAQKYGC